MNERKKFPISHRIGITMFAILFAIAVYFRWSKTPWIFHGYAIDFCWGYLYLEIRNQHISKFLPDASVRKQMVVAALCAFGITFFLEVIQIWIPQRTHDPWDYLAYSLGIMTAISIDLVGLLFEKGADLNPAELTADSKD